MRRIVRTVAASFVIILGLALVSVAAFSSDIVNSDLVKATLPEAPRTASQGAEVAPFNPKADNGPASNVRFDAPDVFGAEFGKRGTHEVTVSMSGPGFYQVNWRDGKVENGAGALNTTRKVKGGFPLALIGVNGAGNAISCTITIDGVKKDTQTTDEKNPIVFCEA